MRAAASVPTARAGGGAGDAAGIGLAVAAVALFAAYDSNAKLVSAVTPVALLLWVRYLLQLLWIGARLRTLWAEGAFHTRRPWLHATRALVLLACNVAAFLSYKHLPMATVTAIVMLMPMLLTVVDAVLFGERVPARQWARLAVGLAGALLITRPFGQALDPLLALPLAFLLTYTVFQVMTSRLTRTDSPDAVLVRTSVIGFGALSAVLPWSWTGWPTPGHGAIVLLAAACSGLGHHLMVMAYRRTAPSRITPFLYLQLPFAALGGFLLFGEVPDAWALAGGLLIAVSGVCSVALAPRPASR